MAWHDNPKELADFADACERAGITESATDVLRKPYKFEEIHDLWVQYDFPSEEDENWDDFVKSLNDENPG